MCSLPRIRLSDRRWKFAAETRWLPWSRLSWFQGAKQRRSAASSSGNALRDAETLAVRWRPHECSVCRCLQRHQIWNKRRIWMIQFCQCLNAILLFKRNNHSILRQIQHGGLLVYCSYWFVDLRFAYCLVYTFSRVLLKHLWAGILKRHAAPPPLPFTCAISARDSMSSHGTICRVRLLLWCQLWRWKWYLDSNHWLPEIAPFKFVKHSPVCLQAYGA